MEKNLKKNKHEYVHSKYMYIWSIVNQLYFNFQKGKQINKIN